MKGRYGNRKYRPSTRQSTRLRKLSGNTWRASSLNSTRKPNTPALAGVTFGALLDRYIAEEMPQRKSTKGGYLSIINSKLRPQWGSLLLSEIRPAQVHTWLQHLDLAPVTKGHIKSLMHKLFDLATLWEYLPLERRNPIEIVKVKNVTMRTNEVLVLSAEQFREIAPRLPEHVNMIAMAAACLGLRVSEILGLQWSDIDWEKQTVSIRRSAYRGAIDDTKNNSSKANSPCIPPLQQCCLLGRSSGLSGRRQCRSARHYESANGLSRTMNLDGCLPTQTLECRTCRLAFSSAGFGLLARPSDWKVWASIPCATRIELGWIRRASLPASRRT